MASKQNTPPERSTAARHRSEGDWLCLDEYDEVNPRCRKQCKECAERQENEKYGTPSED